MAVKDTIETVNSTFRTLIGLAAVGLVGTAGWFGYSTYQGPKRELAAKEAALVEAQRELQERDQRLSKQRQEIGQLQGDIASLKTDIDRLETARRLLKVDHRVAELRVIDQQPRPGDGRPMTRIEFVEINDDGAPLGERKTFEIEGDTVFVAARVAQFEDTYVEAADLHRGTSICSFLKIFGEFQEPSKGFELDKVGTRPTAYARGGKMSDFEQGIWDDFWNLANDPERAKKFGIRALQLEAPAMQVRKGATYRLTLRASGGLSFKRVEDETPSPQSDGA